MSAPVFDHLMYAAPDLDAAVAGLETRLGVHAEYGGEHAGLGTHNAVLGLGDQRYLEIIAPLPDRTDVSPFAAMLAALPAPRNFAWAVRTDIDRFVADAEAGDYDAGSIAPMSRQVPDGSTLTWRVSLGGADVLAGIVPFAIQWDCAAHPADTAPAGCTFRNLRAEHPEPERLRNILHALHVDLPVDAGPAPALILAADTPNGPIELR